MACECLIIEWQWQDASLVTIPLIPSGTFNGRPYYAFTAHNGQTLYLFYESQTYYISDVLAYNQDYIASGKDFEAICSLPFIDFDLNTGSEQGYTLFDVKQGDCSGCCVTVITNGQPLNSFQANPNGTTFYGLPVYQFTDGLFGNWIIRYDAEVGAWQIIPCDASGIITGSALAQYNTLNPTCPIALNWQMYPTEEPILAIDTLDCEAPLPCLQICYSLPASNEPKCIDVAIYEVVNGRPSYKFQVEEYPDVWFTIQHFGAGFFPPPFNLGGWYLFNEQFYSYLDSSNNALLFPFTDDTDSYGWSQNEVFNIFTTTQAKECPVEPLVCDCGMKFTFTNAIGEEFTFELTSDSLQNGRAVYEFPLTDLTAGWVVYWDGYSWILYNTNTETQIAKLFGNFSCPIGKELSGMPPVLIGYWLVTDDFYTDALFKSEGISCTKCGIEDRIQKKYDAVKLPNNNVEPDLGNNDCCCRQLVLGGNGNTWETDITPMWIKLDANGNAVFKLLKDGQTANYIVEQKPIVKEPNGLYAEVHWKDVLSSDGAGCFTLVIEYNIAGIVGQVVWGNYELMPYSVTNAMYTARVRAIFNSYFAKDDIDFTDTNMQGTLRFNGMIGKRQPNTEIDNLLYGTREMKSVIRENLNSYSIETDPLDECVIKPLVDLYLLHENNLFIADYNYHNHSYFYKDLPVILEESAEIEYYDWSRKAKVSAKVSDKVKNDRNYYK